jgi:predicted acylesterase/phospholipase RssA
MIPTRIYLSGGGICAMAHVGALMELSSHIPLSAIKEWMGVSAGSLVALCLAIGFTLEETYEVCVRFDFTQIKEMDSIQGWILHFGLDTGERLLRLVHACLHVKGFPSSLTFEALLQQTGKSLRVIATDLNDATPAVFSPDTSPRYHVADAVRASMGAPYLFQPFPCPETGHYLIDGAVISNYPLFVLPVSEHTHTLSILIRTNVEPLRGDIAEVGIDELLTRPLYVALREKAEMETRLYDTRVIQIQLGEINILDFSLEEATKQEIIRRGQEAVRVFWAIPRRERRHSI